MTKLIQQLNFSSSISNYYGASAIEIEPNPLKEKNLGDGASLNAAAASKRSALSASDAECFSLCLGAGPLWWSDVPADDSAPPGGVNSGASSPATPSTPTHDDNNRDLLSGLLWCSASSLVCSAESLTEPSPTGFTAQQQREREATIAKILSRKDRQPVKIDFKILLTENTVTRWEAVLQGNTIYLRVPGVLQSGSKESFMLLLDFAEERLGCKNCIICVLKSRPDRATLLRTFMFMGFQLLAPTSPLMPHEINNPDYIFLHYNMQ
ncbi:LOW QUALITY PROTEIN: ornithine decarboxylase antizyme 2 [Plodia interpunctella]|uniref:LOW QUALITY PROTEIN: ornithine decarboxylase antizyme 2 n=1 Tax=Plodia interpunctella TaxID=58824 RepID=UPI002367D389|nr:LOW QUALITY PROTEIN: ornithine decarboxylase antizyme 2 [Plodia interpunctella]